jgi:hypothetical protein
MTGLPDLDQADGLHVVVDSQLALATGLLD